MKINKLFAFKVSVIAIFAFCAIAVFTIPKETNACAYYEACGGYYGMNYGNYYVPAYSYYTSYGNYGYYGNYNNYGYGGYYGNNYGNNYYGGYYGNYNNYGYGGYYGNNYGNNYYGGHNYGYGGYGNIVRR